MLRWEEYTRYRISRTQPSELRHAELVRLVDSLQAAQPQNLQVTQLGESVEGLSISLLTLGNGP